MKSIFILGASRLQLPAILKAKELGLYVYVLDYDPNAIGIQYADLFLEISTIDKEAVLDAAKKYKPDYIITSTSDMPVRTVSWVCEQLGMKTDISFENAMCATNKKLMRRRMKEQHVPIPEFYEITELGEFIDTFSHLDGKYVVKPADNAASRGVVFVDTDEKLDLKKIYEYCVNYSRGAGLLIEEYMEGPEVSVEAFSVNGEAHIITITDKIVTDLPFFVELGHTEPSRLSKEQQDDIHRVALAAIKAIGMVNGPTHTEIKVTESGAKLVEIAARLGGDFITSRLVPLSTGVDMIECSYDALFGKSVRYKSVLDRGAAIRFIQGSEGKLVSISGLDQVKSMDNVVEFEIYKSIGDYIRKPENSSDRIGHIIAVGKDANEADCIANEALSKIKIETVI
ncbi:MAG: ATP-grasp domain-containing protein [Lachnospiraceae bacterium]|nr:ATP-grasp domain-containing protein [Lachnospiraceae bacterium]